MTSYVGFEQSGDGGTHDRTIPYPYFDSHRMTRTASIIRHYCIGGNIACLPPGCAPHSPMRTASCVPVHIVSGHRAQPHRVTTPSGRAGPPSTRLRRQHRPQRPELTRWLPPGHLGTLPIDPDMSNQLTAAGIDARDGRHAALVNLAAALPPPVLASLLGVSYQHRHRLEPPRPTRLVRLPRGTPRGTMRHSAVAHHRCAFRQRR